MFVVAGSFGGFCVRILELALNSVACTQERMRRRWRTFTPHIMFLRPTESYAFRSAERCVLYVLPIVISVILSMVFGQTNQGKTIGHALYLCSLISI